MLVVFAPMITFSSLFHEWGREGECRCTASGGSDVMLNPLPLSAVPWLYAHRAVSRAVVTPSPHLPAPCCAFRLIGSRASRFRFLRGESRPTSKGNRAQARSGKTLFRVSVPRSLGASSGGCRGRYFVDNRRQSELARRVGTYKNLSCALHFFGASQGQGVSGALSGVFLKGRVEWNSAA